MDATILSSSPDTPFLDYLQAERRLRAALSDSQYKYPIPIVKNMNTYSDKFSEIPFPTSKSKNTISTQTNDFSTSPNNSVSQRNNGLQIAYDNGNSNLITNENRVTFNAHNQSSHTAQQYVPSSVSLNSNPSALIDTPNLDVLNPLFLDARARSINFSQALNLIPCFDGNSDKLSLFCTSV